jgi:hypothetical protein
MASRNWVDATDLSLWANRLDSQSRLPQLLRLLIRATVRDIRLIDFPAGESVQIGGYDGKVQVLEGNDFVPDGFSVWELGTNKDIKGKADDDYDKRCKAPLETNPAETTFIFVTPRRWANKDKWIQEKNTEGIWAEVRAYDADNLEQWLEIAPAVHSWLARLIGNFPEGALSLGDFWDEWRFSTSPPMNTELHLAGRHEATEKINTWLTGTPSSLTVQADSREEAIAFFAAVVYQLEEEEGEYYLSRCVIAQDELSWRHLIATQGNLILLPDFNNPSGIGNAIFIRKHHILIPTGRENTASNNALKLPRIEREGFKNALINMGLSQEHSRSLIQESKRSLLIFRRQKATNPEIHCPEWAKPENAPSLIPALLIGSWDDSKEKDRQVIEEITRKPYAEVSVIFSRWVNESDPPVWRIGDIWQLKSRDDSWHLLSRFLLHDDLEAFQKAFLSVLTIFDPRYDLPIDKQFMAAAYGKTLAHSHQLRQGLAETLALIASRGDKIQGTVSFQTRANIIVHNLLTSENDWKLWASLSDLLPILAESAPESFMDAVEHALSEENPFLIDIFTDADPMHGSPHTGLLWALETVAWEPQYLSRVTLILGKLSRLDPGGRLVNRPIRSLNEIFLWWHPQTLANLEQRLKVIDTLLLRESNIAWNLICSLFPTRHSNTAFGTHKPRWRDWVADYKPSVTYGEINQWSDAISERILSNVGISGDRWEKLLDLLQSLSATFRDRAIQNLLDISQQADLLSSEKLKIWEVLRVLIHRHRRYSSAAWVLPSELIDQLCIAYENLEPPDSISLYAWLFSASPQLPDGVSEDWQENEKALNNARIEAIEQIFGQGGLSELLQVASQVYYPIQFGVAIGQSKIASQVECQLLDSTLGDDSQLLRDVAIGFVSGCFNINQWSWARNILAAETSQQWSALKIVVFFLGLPFSTETWEHLKNYGAEIETQYWKIVRGWWIGKEAGEIIVKKFLEVNRPYRALNIASLCLNESGGNNLLPDSLIANVLESILQYDSKETPAPDLSCFDYEVAKLFFALDKSKDFDKTLIAQLEWAYLPLLIHSERQPKLLHQELSQNPLFFVEVLTFLYRSDKEEDNALEPSVEDQTRARLALELLESWEKVPGLGEDGKIIPEQIKTWVEQAREACLTSGRGAIGDQEIGKILAYAPADSNCIWPDVSVRELIEEISSKDLEAGIAIGIYNKCGVWTKSLSEGGRQERELAGTYLQHATAIADEYPRTASLLRRIAHSYTADAHREDIHAELRDA